MTSLNTQPNPTTQPLVPYRDVDALVRATATILKLQVDQPATWLALLISQVQAGTVPVPSALQAAYWHGRTQVKAENYQYGRHACRECGGAPLLETSPAPEGTACDFVTRVVCQSCTAQTPWTWGFDADPGGARLVALREWDRLNSPDGDALVGEIYAVAEAPPAAPEGDENCHSEHFERESSGLGG